MLENVAASSQPLFSLFTFEFYWLLSCIVYYLIGSESSTYIYLLDKIVRSERDLNLEARVEWRIELRRELRIEEELRIKSRSKRQIEPIIDITIEVENWNSEELELISTGTLRMKLTR